tara:strand:- start:2596 stop:2826 length:231 start_codon:yes stop_codon:yes gene_type:complete
MGNSIPGPVDGLSSVASDEEPIIMRLTKQLMNGKESTSSKVSRALVILDEAEAEEPNEILRQRISISTSLLREGPK